jgi:hypothetical protein
MTEQELTELCREYGATLRKRNWHGSAAYEAYKRAGAKVRSVYLIAVSKLPEADSDVLSTKLAKLQE